MDPSRGRSVRPFVKYNDNMITIKKNPFRTALTGARPIAKRLRAKFWPDCAILDTSMKFCTVVGHDRLSRIGYITTLGNAYCACAKHFLILGCYHRAFIQFDFKEGVMLAAE